MKDLKVLVIGSGGREHALVWKIARSPLVRKVYAAPGNAGISALAECVALKPSDQKGLLDFVKKENIDLTVVGPELPLVEGIADLFRAEGRLIFGPGRAAARLEGSKVFSKDRMKKFGIPTASCKEYPTAEATARDLETCPPLFVIKSDGLAAGKGVSVVTNENERQEVIRQLHERRFPNPNGKHIKEDYLKGEELSILAFTDGEKVLPLASSQDHKRAFDHEEGPNTGGMGAYSPCPAVTESEVETLAEKTITPLIRGLAGEGIRYQGLIYAGLMLTERGPYVLEYNVRFGDPETQAVLPRLDEDLVPVLLEVAEGRLTKDRLKWKAKSALNIVLASGGYPGDYPVGFEIKGLDAVRESEDLIVFHAGTARSKDGKTVTAGGRVLNVTALGGTLQEARSRAYEAAEKIQFQGLFFRKDIGWRALTKV